MLSKFNNKCYLVFWFSLKGDSILALYWKVPHYENTSWKTQGNVFIVGDYQNVTKYLRIVPDLIVTDLSGK